MAVSCETLTKDLCDARDAAFGEPVIVGVKVGPLVEHLYTLGRDKSGERTLGGAFYCFGRRLNAMLFVPEAQNEALIHHEVEVADTAVPVYLAEDWDPEWQAPRVHPRSYPYAPRAMAPGDVLVWIELVKVADRVDLIPCSRFGVVEQVLPEAVSLARIDRSEAMKARKGVLVDRAMKGRTK